MSLYCKSKDIPDEILDGIFSKQDLLESLQSANDDYSSKDLETSKESLNSEALKPENLEALKNLKKWLEEY